MKRIIAIITVIISLSSAFSVQAAQVPREALPCNATEEQIIVTERLVGHIAWLNKQTYVYAFGELVTIANNAIWQYRVYNKILFKALA